MKLLQQTSLVMLAGLISACGSSDNSSSATGHEEHGHKILVSQVNSDSLSLVHEGVLEAQDGNVAGNGAIILLSGNGEFAATVSAGMVNFVHGGEHEEGHTEESAEEENEEAEILSYSLSGNQVINTLGHFSVLNAGITTLVAYEQLEATTPAVETIDVVGQTFPALVLEEAEEVILVFANNTATVYEDDVATNDAQACTAPTSAAQNAEYAVFSCDEGNFAVALEEGATDHTIEFTDLDTIGSYAWAAQGEVVVGLNQADKKQIRVVEHNASEELEVGTITTTDNTCALALDSVDGDILLLNDNNQFQALNHEGTVLNTITLDDEIIQASCSDLVLATAAKTALVVNNAAPKLYVIDMEAGATAYHIHERQILTVSDVQSMVIFHEKDDAQAHDHSH